jgi:hypothetical protein
MVSKQVVVVKSTLKKYKTINAEDIMSFPTSLSRGENVFAKNVELAFAA